MALADAYTNLVHVDGTESSRQVDPEIAFQELQPFIGTQFDAECYDALCRFVRGSKRVQPHNQTVREANVGGLTDREMEVLRLVAQGKKNPEIAKLLYISRKTVEHHLSHIYNKLGVSCRTSAVAFAMQRQFV
jgi:DNA-binding NarL/FixJ family response regulator